MKKINVRNFRSLKDYVNKYGEKINPNKIYRGGSLGLLSQEEKDYFYNKLNIKYVLDFRDELEAGLDPDVLSTGTVYQRISSMGLISTDFDNFDFGSILSSGNMNEEKIGKIKNYLLEGYRQMAFSNLAYQELFNCILNDDGNIYIHCTAGKDRTGIGVFLIMIALGISEKDSIEEYLLSNEYLEKGNDELCKMLGIDENKKEKCMPFLQVREEYIKITIEEINRRYGNYDDFLFNEYGLDKIKREKLRKICCQ